MEDGPYKGTSRDADKPSGLLPTDEYTVQLERLRGVTTNARGRVDTTGPYGHTRTWLLETHRVSGVGDWTFLQRVGQGPNGPEALMLVFPPEVTDLWARQRESLTEQNRRKGARRAAATREAKGLLPAFVKDPSLRGKGGRRKKKSRRTARRKTRLLDKPFRN